uniref:N-acetyltransferase domain-containing protein n=1 Tax=Schizophyllum commune (strain H4-8 / FGSC 9210) TaxID=578458 RepID=D8PZ38_SCHCM
MDASSPADVSSAAPDPTAHPDGPTDVAIRKISVEETLPLRHAVLWPNLPISATRLPDDDIGSHFGVFSSSSTTPIAVISIFNEPLPIDKPQGSKAVRFRKFACHQDHQGRGIGTALLRHVFWVAAAEMGAHAKRGMHPFGERFYKGPVEYVRMSITADDALEEYRRAGGSSSTKTPSF